MGIRNLISQLWPEDVQQKLIQPAGESSVTPYGARKINSAEKTEAAAGGRWKEEGAPFFFEKGIGKKNEKEK